MSEQGGKWAAVSSALQFAGLLERGELSAKSASYVTTGVHNTFEHMVSALGRSPTSSFVPCSLFGNALDLPQQAYLDFPRRREWQATAAHYRTLFAAYGIQPEALH